MAKRRFVVKIQRGERWWVADIPKVHGCHTQGRNLAQTRRNIRDCLALLIGERAAKDADLEEEKRLISENADEMKTYLEDVNTNAPKDKDMFPLVNDAFMCNNCNYYELCAPELNFD